MKDRCFPVFYQNQKVGVLFQKGKEINFEYDLDWKQFPLSFHLPLSHKENFDDSVTRTYFENLLPNDALLDMLSKAGKFSRHDLMSFFAMYGKECAGAISIGEPQLPETKELKDITDEIRQFLDADMGGTLQLALKSRLSLAGTQDKLPVIFKNGRFFLPDGLTTHILKPGNKSYPCLVQNEHFCLELAKEMGCYTVQSKIVSLSEKHDVLVIERYDRKKENQKVVCLHQQDFCQALGLLPDCKYQGNGEFFGFADMTNICRKHDINFRDFYARALIANYLLGNCDGHAKNFSLIFDNGQWKPTPLYDLVCTVVYPGLDAEMAMTFGTTLQRGKVGEEDIGIAARDTDIGEEEFRELAKEMAKVCKDAAPEIAFAHGMLVGERKIYDLMLGKILPACDRILEIIEKPVYRQEM